MRQLGSVLGVALAIVLSTTERPFEATFGAVVACGLLTSLVCLALPSPAVATQALNPVPVAVPRA